MDGKNKYIIYLNENRERFFSSHEDMITILQGINHVYLLKEEPFLTSNREFDKSLSFGQFISHYAQKNDLSMARFACLLKISVEKLGSIYDDEIFPWELPVILTKKMAETLNVSLLEVVEIINSHPLEPRLILNRFKLTTQIKKGKFKTKKMNRVIDNEGQKLIFLVNREENRKMRYLHNLK